MSNRCEKNVITVRPALKPVRDTCTQGLLRFHHLNLPCALGRSGLELIKREGDGATPVGQWRLNRILYRSDRIARPQSGLPVQAIDPHDGWCDQVFSANYNRPVSLPNAHRAETLRRDDSLYNLLVVIDYNICPRIQGRGSAIFMHVAKESSGRDKPFIENSFNATEGCVALRLKDLTRLVKFIRPGTEILISN